MRPYGADTLWFASRNMASKLSRVMCLDSSRWVSLFISRSHSSSWKTCIHTQYGWWEYFEREKMYFKTIYTFNTIINRMHHQGFFNKTTLSLQCIAFFTTMDVRSSLSKRLMAWSRDLYMAAEILWVISLFRSMERPRSCQHMHASYWLKTLLIFPHDRTIKSTLSYKILKTNSHRT